MKHEYKEFPFTRIKELIKEGQEAAKKYNSIEDLIYDTDYTFAEAEYVKIGFNNPKWEIGEVKTFYRIGEPAIDEDGCSYMNSCNHVINRFEEGISVVTMKWLHSLKAIFFGTSDEDIQMCGIYRITGFELPYRGGDDEVLIKALDWAEKTRIRTRKGLEKAVRDAEQKQA